MPTWTNNSDRVLGKPLTLTPDVANRRQTLYFYQDNVAASQAAVALTCLGDAARTGYVLPFGAEIVGVAVYSNVARTAGTLTVDPTIAGTVIGLQAILNGTDTTVAYATQTNYPQDVLAGQLIGVKITTSAAWLPATADVLVGVTVEY